MALVDPAELGEVLSPVHPHIRTLRGQLWDDLMRELELYPALAKKLRHIHVLDEIIGLGTSGNDGLDVAAVDLSTSSNESQQTQNGLNGHSSPAVEHWEPSGEAARLLREALCRVTRFRPQDVFSGIMATHPHINRSTLGGALRREMHRSNVQQIKFGVYKSLIGPGAPAKGNLFSEKPAAPAVKPIVAREGAPAPELVREFIRQNPLFFPWQVRAAVNTLRPETTENAVYNLLSKALKRWKMVEKNPDGSYRSLVYKEADRVEE